MAKGKSAEREAVEQDRNRAERHALPAPLGVDPELVATYLRLQISELQRAAERARREDAVARRKEEEARLFRELLKALAYPAILAVALVVAAALLLALDWNEVARALSGKAVETAGPSVAKSVTAASPSAQKTVGNVILSSAALAVGVGTVKWAIDHWETLAGMIGLFSAWLATRTPQLRYPARLVTIAVGVILFGSVVPFAVLADERWSTVGFTAGSLVRIGYVALVGVFLLPAVAAMARVLALAPPTEMSPAWATRLRDDAARSLVRVGAGVQGLTAWISDNATPSGILSRTAFFAIPILEIFLMLLAGTNPRWLLPAVISLPLSFVWLAWFAAVSATAPLFLDPRQSRAAMSFLIGVPVLALVALALLTPSAAGLPVILPIFLVAVALFPAWSIWVGILFLRAAVRGREALVPHSVTAQRLTMATGALPILLLIIVMAMPVTGPDVVFLEGLAIVVALSVGTAWQLWGAAAVSGIHRPLVVAAIAWEATAFLFIQGRVFLWLLSLMTLLAVCVPMLVFRAEAVKGGVTIA